MSNLKPKGLRWLISITPGVGFAYVLSLLFEGPVFYTLCEHFDFSPAAIIMTGIISQCIGLFSCGFFVRTGAAAKKTMIVGFAVCFVMSTVFFFPPSFLWYVAMAVCNFAAGWMLAAWGYFLNLHIAPGERIKVCAELLIISNVIMIFNQTMAVNMSAFLGLALSLAVLPIGIVLALKIPTQKQGVAEAVQPPKENPMTGSIKKPMLILFAFVAVITINSGLMYQVLNPAFAHHTWLVSWYWAVPYIIALAIVRGLPFTAKRSRALYLGMGMIMASFLFFMFLDRSAGSYFVVNTLMLGTCGIFDLFWWSILDEMSDYGKNPVQIFGIGLSANIIGIIIGNFISFGLHSTGMSDAYVTVVALTVVCITLVLLPPLNRMLVMALKAHTYLNAFALLPEKQQEQTVQTFHAPEPLTERENEVLLQILSGKSNREIGETLCISESTVKTHVRNIFQKYEVSGRAELISMLLRGQNLK